MHARHGTFLRAAAALAATLALCGALAARAPDRTPADRALDSLFFAGRYDTLRTLLPPLIRAAEARGDSAALGRLAFQKGRVEITLGHQAIASGDLDRALRLTEAARDSLWLCAALHFKAFILRDSGNPDAAMQLFEREQEIGRRSRLPGAEAAAISNLAYKDLRRGNLDAARRGYARMMELYRKSGNMYQIAGAGLSLGQLYRALGDIDSCRWAYRETLRLSRQHHYPMHELWALNNLGLMEMDTGNWESAASYYERALAIGRRIGFDRGQALPLMNLALAWSFLGENDRAQRSINDAIEVCRRAGFKDLEVGNTNVLATLSLDAGRSRQAAALFRRFVNEDVFNRLQRSEAAYGLALALADMDSVGQALQVLEPFVAPKVETPDFTVQAYFEMAYAELLYRDGRYAEALDRSIRLREEMDRTGRTDLGVAARLLESPCRRQLGDRRSAVGTLELALDSLEVARTDMGNAEWREAYGQRVMAEVIDGCRVMLEYPADAPREERERRFYDTLQHFKTRTLLERIRDPRGDAGAPVSSPLAHATTLLQLQREILRPGELLLDFFVSPRETFLFAITPDSCRMVSLPESHARLAERFALYTDVLSTANRATRDAYRPERLAEMQQALGSVVLDAVADLVEGARRIVVAPDGAFASIPLGTLMLDDGKMLIERGELIEVPSASVLAWARDLPAPATTATLTAVEGGTGDLEGARREVRSLERRYAGVDVVAAGEGLLDTLVHGAKPGRILHIAAHARVNDDSPWQSGFVLAADTASAPVTLRAWEIARAKLPYEMGVLAGCQTAGGRATNGEGVLGLTSAFLGAGVPVVVSSRWPVDDRATAVLMNHFYDRLAAGETVASAFRHAQLAVRADPRTRHPFYWAGFSVVGDATRIIAPAVASSRATWLKTVAGAFVVIGIATWAWRRRRAAGQAPA